MNSTNCCVRINLGCGRDIRTGYVNVDVGALWGCNVPPGCLVYDLNRRPWTFAEDGCADEVLMNHVLEHLPDTGGVLGEVWRILKSGGRFWGQVPYGPGHAGRTHWQHCRYFVARSFQEMAADNGFELVRARNGVHRCSWRHRLRNAVPLREWLALAGWSEAFDVVDFDMRKP